MWKKILVFALFISAAFEFVFSVAGFVAPQFTMKQFSMPYDDQTAFLGYVISWFLLFVTVIAFLVARQVARGVPSAWPLASAMGLWWIGIGVGIFLMFKKPDNLILDSLKGTVIFVSALKSRPDGAR
jgi:hypothetical protein